MIKFFRKIRQRLITENKFSKYILYAFGEIILVVIGILIALQINNWNSERISSDKERGILLELKAGLESDKQLLKQTLDTYKTHHEMLLQLDSLIGNPEYEYHVELNELFGKVYGIRFVRLNPAFYEDLKSNGLQLIKDESIRLGIVNLFEFKYSRLQSFLEHERSVNFVIRPYYLENFTAIDFQASADPLDFNKIWSDPYFKNILHYRIITLETNQLKHYQSTIMDIDIVIENIDTYLKLSNE